MVLHIVSFVGVDSVVIRCSSVTNVTFVLMISFLVTLLTEVSISDVFTTSVADEFAMEMFFVIVGVSSMNSLAT